MNLPLAQSWCECTLKAECSSSFKEWISCLRYWISDSLMRSNTYKKRQKITIYKKSLRVGQHFCNGFEHTSSSYTSLPWVSGDSAVSPLKQERMRLISAVSRLFNSCWKRQLQHMRRNGLSHPLCICVCIQTWLWAFSSWFSLWHCLRAWRSASSAWARWAFSRHFWEYCSDSTSSSLWMDCSSSLHHKSKNGFLTDVL